jgi:hypothetical protein
MYTFINFILCLLIFIPVIIILITLRGKKPYKVKQDILFIEKLILQILILTFYLLLFIYELLEDQEDEEEKKDDNENSDIVRIFFKTKIICFNVYIVLLFMNNFFLCLEDYFTYTNPIYYFNSLFHKRKNNILYEFISISLAAVLSLLYLNIDLYINKEKYLILLMDNNGDNNYLEINENSPFIILNSLKLFLALILNIIIIILYIVLRLKIMKIIFKSREKLFSIFYRKIISSLLYTVFILFNIFLFFQEKKADSNLTIIRIINSYLFLLVYGADIVLEFITYSTSKFAQYKLKHTIVNSIGSYLNKNKEEEYPTNSFLDSILFETEKIKQRKNKKYNNNNDIDDDEDEENPLIMPLNSNDIELVLIYRNKIFIEDYFYYYYDYIMNVTLSALFKIYTNKKFSPSALKNKQLNKELNITESAIFADGEKNSNNNTFSYNNNTLKKNDTDGSDGLFCESSKTNDEFLFVRNTSKNDFFYIDEIFTNTINDFSYDNISVKINSFFTSKCVSNILDKNISTTALRDSLRSHLNTNNNENDYMKNNKINLSSTNNFDLPYHSILSCNAKEEYFLHLKNMSIKSYDKQLTFDIFESNDDDISTDIDNSNQKLALMLDRYFDYIRGVGISSTFLPILLGVFKVKINSFKTMLIYISCSSLVENSPLNNYSYWQLVRFSYNNKEKIASSKYRHNALIGDEFIFDRKFALPTVKEDNDNSYNKIEMKNYFNFKETLKHDIEFLTKHGANKTNLLMMYFEYQNVRNSDLSGAIKIRKNEDNKAEIINISCMPILNEEEESKDNISESHFSKKDYSEIATIPTNPLSSLDINKDNKSPEASKLNSVLNANLIIENKKENINKNDGNENKKNNNTNINENLVIESTKNEGNKDLNSKKNFSRYQSLCGSLSNAEFIDEALISYDEAGLKQKNNPELNNHDMLNYFEKIQINSYDGYFDSFNCICLFSFENIFEIKKEGCCHSTTNNQLKKNILENFNDYIPRKHTIVSKSTKETLNK